MRRSSIILPIIPSHGAALCFDFKGSDARVEQKEHELTAYADSDFQLGQVRDVLTNKMAKRNVDVRFLDLGKIEKIGGDKVKQVIKHPG
ncbi:MAG: hypothetical protein RLZ64_1884 [Pseudomonadota bacterium]